MKKLALIFLLIVPFLADAQVRIWQLSSRDKTNTVQPAGKTIFTDGANSFEFGSIDTSKVAGLAQYIIDHTIKSATDSVKLDGTVLQIFSAGSATPTTVNLSTIIDNAGKIDSLKFEANYLKIYQRGESVPDSVLIPTPNAEGINIADIGNYYSGSDVEAALQQIGAQIASGGDNWGTQAVVTGPGLSGDGTVSNPLAAAVTSVNGQTGTVTISPGVTSVNGQTGTVVITTTDDQTAAEVSAADVGNYFSGTTVEDILQELGADIASGGDNWGSQVVAIGSGLSGQGTTASPLTTTIEGNATHTGEVTGNTALTIADNVIDYGNVAATLKGNVTNNTLTWDISSSGIITCAITGNGSVTFINSLVNKMTTVVLTITNSAVITWPSYAKILNGSATLGNGTFYIYIHCISSTLYTVSITKEA